MSLENVSVEELERVLVDAFALEYRLDIVTEDSTTYYNALQVLNPNQVRPTVDEILAHLPAIRIRMREERADHVIVHQYTTGKLAVLLGKAIEGDRMAEDEIRRVIAHYEAIP